MDFVKAQFERIRQQLNGLNASQRMLTVSLLVIMGITLLYWVRYAGKPEMEALLDQSISAEDVGRIREKLNARGVSYQITGDRILVPSDRKQEVLIGLSYDQVLPQNTSVAFDAMVGKLSSWSSETQNAQWWLQAKQATLADVIRGWPGVQGANVIIDMTEHRGFGDKAVKQSATINIKTREERAGAKKLVKSAADLVAGAQSGLDRGRIRVVVNGVSYPVQDDGADSIAGVGDLVEARQVNEAYYNAKIQQQLGWLHAEVYAQVTVDINNKVTQEESEVYDPKGTAKVESKIKSKGTDENTDSKAAAEPGVGANTQGSVADSGGGGAKQTRNETDDETEFQTGLSKKQTSTREGPGRATVLGATVRVPQSYFVRAFKGADQTAKDPDEATLQPYLERQLGKIRAEVQKCTGLADEKAVVVDTYLDGVPGVSGGDATTLAVVPPSGVTGVVTVHAKEIALGVLAVVSLFMMSTMVKKGAPAPVMANIPEPIGPPQQLSNGEEVVGEAGDGETILGGMELDEDAAKTQQMLGQVSDLVKDNPDAAANLIKRWMNK